MRRKWFVCMLGTEATTCLTMTWPCAHLVVRWCADLYWRCQDEFQDLVQPEAQDVDVLHVLDAGYVRKHLHMTVAECDPTPPPSAAMEVTMRRP